jgi:hypothetical protein
METRAAQKRCFTSAQVAGEPPPGELFAGAGAVKIAAVRNPKAASVQGMIVPPPAFM